MTKSYFLTAVAFFFLFSCNPDKDKRVKKEGVEFKSSEASRMFFKNTRLLYYDLEAHEPTKREMYRLGARITEGNGPVLNLCIVNDWKNDLAYLMLEPNTWFKPPYNIQLMATSTTSDEKQTIAYEMGNIKQQYRFASEIYDAMIAEKALSVEKDGEWHPILRSEKAREAYRITMIDYYRLIDGFSRKNLDTSVSAEK